MGTNDQQSAEMQEMEPAFPKMYEKMKAVASDLQLELMEKLLGRRPSDDERIADWRSRVHTAGSAM